METPKPHPHAELIKAWAEGAIIQSRSEFGGWVDEVNSNPTWDPSVEYRIKPEEPSNEPWKPKDGGEYWFIGVDFTPENAIWRDDSFDRRYFKYGNCFRTKEEAEAAIPRVEAALKGTTDVSDNVGTNVGSPELDGEPLSEGEKALVKALRSSGIFRVMEKPIVVYHDSEGKALCGSEFIVFDTYAAEEDQNEIIAALKQIKAEQGASND